MENKFEYDEVIHEVKDKGGAYVNFPWNIKELFGKGRVKVNASFDGIPYRGSIVNMGVRDDEGNICYIIGVLKSIRAKIKKLWIGCIKYITPILLVVVTVSGFISVYNTVFGA